MFEHRKQPLLKQREYLLRQLKFVFFGLTLIFGSLGIGVIGYHFTEDLPWLDSLVNASMILFGEGPLGELHTDAGKWFASFYAMFSGVAFVGFVGIIFAPLAHRIFHKFHLEEK